MGGVSSVLGGRSLTHFCWLFGGLVGWSKQCSGW